MTWSGNMKHPGNYRQGQGRRSGQRRQKSNTPSPVNFISTSPRYSPKYIQDGQDSSADEIRRGSPSPKFELTNIAYAGARFNDPPAPTVLPKPPSHWMISAEVPEADQCDHVSNQLKMLLKVQVSA